jgi:hypothetical protein
VRNLLFSWTLNHVLAAETSALLPAFATVFGNMFLQPGNRHGHSIRQLPLFRPGYLPQSDQAAHPISGFDVLAFEPSMFRTSHR